jgi:hypothetical protein
MGGLSEMLDFEVFNLKDMLGKLKDNPESLLLGVDPISTGLWNALGVGGGNQEPLVNVLGGPMGGDALGIGSGGVYDRAQATGINTKNAMRAHDLAEIIAAMYTMQWAGGQIPGNQGTGNSEFNWQRLPNNLPGQRGNSGRRSNFSQTAQLADQLNQLSLQLKAAQDRVLSAKNQQEKMLALGDVERIRVEISMIQQRLQASSGNANGGGA